MDCPKCKTANSEDAIFCIMCGERMTLADVAPKAENVPVAQPTASPAVMPIAPVFAGPAGPVPYAMPVPPMYVMERRGDKSKNWQAICSMICGIASIPMIVTTFGGLFTAIAAICFSIKGFKSQRSGMAIAGVVCGSIGLILSGIMIYSMVKFQLLDPELL